MTPIRRPEDGRLLKPVQAPPRGQREIDFYSRIFSSVSKDSTDKKLRHHVPHFYGVEEYPAKKYEGSLEKGRQYLVLQDLTEGFEEPNILGFIYCNGIVKFTFFQYYLRFIIVATRGFIIVPFITFITYVDLRLTMLGII